MSKIFSEGCRCRIQSQPSGQPGRLSGQAQMDQDARDHLRLSDGWDDIQVPTRSAKGRFRQRLINLAQLIDEGP
jgi:hypothetical protein